MFSMSSTGCWSSNQEAVINVEMTLINVYQKESRCKNISTTDSSCLVDTSFFVDCSLWPEQVMPPSQSFDYKNPGLGHHYTL